MGCPAVASEKPWVIIFHFRSKFFIEVWYTFRKVYKSWVHLSEFFHSEHTVKQHSAKKNPENYQPLRTLPSVTLAPSPQEYPVLLSNSSDTFAFLLKAFVCCGVWGGLWRLSRVAWDRFDARALVPCGALWSTSQDFQRPLQSASVIDGGGALVPAFSHLAPILLHWLFYIPLPWGLRVASSRLPPP